MPQSDVSLVEKIRKQTLLQLAKHQEDLQQYIPVQASLFRDEEHPFTLLDELQKKFIGNPKQDALLLLGDSGAGKTVTGQMLIKTVCENTLDHTLIPLWIPLLSISDPSKQLLKQHLRDHLDLSSEEVNILLQKEKDAYRWLIVLDGYDEINTTQNLAKVNGWQDYRMQLIITCRHDLFHQEDIRLHSHQFALTQPLVLYQVCPFDQKQMGLYIEQYVKIHNTAWSKDTYLSELEKLPGLMALLTNPFILSMAMSALPELVAKYHSDNDNNNVVARVKLTRHALYDTFLKQWFVRQAAKLEAHAGYGERINQMLLDYKAKQTNIKETENVTDISLATLLEDYSRNLAQALWAHRVEVMEYVPVVAQSNKSSILGLISGENNNNQAMPTSPAQEWLAEFLGEGLALKIQRKGCPLKKVGPHRYAFFHKSLQEFLAAEHLFNGALVESWILTGQNLNSSNLLARDTAVVKNLAERVQEDPSFQAVLFNIVEASKTEPSVWQAAANAMTILNRARVSFSSRDLRRVRIGGEEQPGLGWGADLTGAICDGTDFREADLRYVTFSRAHLDRADLTGACLDQADFGEEPRLDGYRVCYSPDGQSLAVVKNEKGVFSEQHWVLIYEVATQQQLQSFKVPSDVNCLAFHPFKAQLATGHHDYETKDYAIRLWDITHGRCERKLSGHTGEILSIAYRPDGQQLASGSWDKTVRLWSVADGKIERVLEGHTNEVTSIAYRPDGQQLASAGRWDHTVRLWSVANGACEQVLKGHTSWVKSIAYRPDGQQLASGSGDHTVRLWSVVNGTCEQVLEGHTGGVESIAYRPDGQQVASSSWDHTVRLWSMARGKMEQVRGHKSPVGSIAYRPDGQQLASCSRYHVRLWSMANDTCKQVLEGHTRPVRSIAYRPDGQQLASGSVDPDYVVRLWSMVDGTCNQVLKGHTDAVACIAYCPDGQQLASGGGDKDKTVRLWSVADGRCEKVLKGHTGKVESIAYRSDGQQLASGSEDHTVRLWSVAEGTCEQVLEGHKWNVNSVAYRPDGQQLASGSGDHTVRLWSVAEGTCEQVLEGHKWNVNSVAYRPDGQQLASGSGDHTVRLWSVARGKMEQVLTTGHAWVVTSVAYRPDGQQLVSGSDDNTVRLWDSITYRCMAVWLADYSAALIWSPDGKQCASGHDSGAIKVWALQTTQSITPQLLWTSLPYLQSVNTQVHQVTGLISPQQRLLQQRGPAQGTVSTRETAKVLSERNAQVYVPSGVIKAPWVGLPGACQITPDTWLVSLLRKRTTQDNNNNNQNPDAGCHAFLLIQGLTEKHFTYLKEIHFFLDSRRPTYFFQTVGWGLIQIRDKSPWDLQAQASHLIAKTWQVTKSEAEQLLANVEADQKKKVGYVKSGRGLNSYSCLTWCEMQLERIGLNLNLQSQWYDFICAIPTNHLPDPKPAEPTTKGSCLVM